MVSWLIAFGVTLDLIIGDPVYRYHPVRLIGGLALYSERICRKHIKDMRLAGGVTALISLLVPVFLTYIITATVLKLSPAIGYICCIFFIYSTIACRDMINHSKEIYRQLTADNLILARAKASMIVGRDTREMTRNEIIRANVESISENTVDGIISPVFYAFLGSLLGGAVGAACGAVLYRVVNTLDSSFGYKNTKYADFGLISARIDDIFNFIPARISFILIALASVFTGLDAKNAVQTAIRDHSKHASPNSGYSEAAFAGALGLQFGGETRYQGEIVTRPLIGTPKNEYQPSAIIQASRLLFNTTIFAASLATLILFFYSL